MEPLKERRRPESKRKKVSFTTGTGVAELARRTMLGTLSSEPLSFSISPIVALYKLLSSIPFHRLLTLMKALTEQLLREPFLPLYGRILYLVKVTQVSIEHVIICQSCILVIKVMILGHPV